MEGQEGQDGGQQPGWYPDPQGSGQRYWDGSNWAEHSNPEQPQGPSPQPPAQGPSPSGQWRSPDQEPSQENEGGGSWRRYRRWPTWLQWAIPVLVVVILVVALWPRNDSPDRDDVAETTETSIKTDTAAQGEKSAAAQTRAKRRRAAASRRARARRERARGARAARRREQQALQARLDREQRLAEEEHARLEREAQQEAEEQPCHAAYYPCLDPNASDYDCGNASGDGPKYAGLVTVKDPSDPFDLDPDGDGTGCD